MFCEMTLEEAIEARHSAEGILRNDGQIWEVP